jgi:hypothetical protein
MWLEPYKSMVTHLHAHCMVDDTTILERQEKAIAKLKNIKHKHGSIQVWLQRFDDAIEECETMGAAVTDEIKCIYLMKNVNKKIFEQTLILWHGVLTRKSFPDKYDTLKAYVMNEYSSQMTHTERAKVIYNMMSAKRKSEPALNATKDGKSNKGKCHVCGRAGHRMKKCWHYDSSMTREGNKKAAEKKIKGKQAAKKQEMAQTPPKKEQKSTREQLHNCLLRRKPACVSFVMPSSFVNHAIWPEYAQGKWISSMIQELLVVSWGNEK